MSRKTDLVIEEGSTNVYADLGYADAAEMQRNSQFAAEIARAIKARRLTQQRASGLLGVGQFKVSRITCSQKLVKSQGRDAGSVPAVLPFCS